MSHWSLPKVYRSDSDGAVLTCTATADVHYTTFDGLYYSSYGSGPFIYSRSTAGQPFEVQARQGSCSGPNIPSEITCVCGVAMREDDAILILDACQDGILRSVGINHTNLPNGSGIFTEDSGYSFRIQMPSGNKVYIIYWGYIMNIRLVVVGRPQVQGMCGSPDGNQYNDLIIQGTNVTLQPEAGGFAGPQGPVDVVDSWRPESGKSLFDFHLEPLPTGGKTSDEVKLPPGSTFPTCSESYIPVYPGDPNRAVSIETEDDRYNPSLVTFEKNTTLLEVSWPTITGITEQEANDTCWSLIVNLENLGPTCMDILRNSISDAQDVVTKCVLDVQLTSDYSWARDKVAELQKSCYFIAITKNNSAINDTEEAIQAVVTEVQKITAFACVPYDCNQHGSCVNGKCICTADYIGSDCKVSKSAIPTVLSLLAPFECDVRTRPCNMANLHVENAASISTLSCKIVVTLRNSSTVTYIENGQINLARTVTCSLPTEPLKFTSASFNFLSAHQPGYSFFCLSSGSPVSMYTISVSNDGVDFSNGITMRIRDGLCMSCTTTACTQEPNTCLINGYCFNAGDSNPYNSELSCQPSISSSTWSNQQARSIIETCDEGGDSVPAESDVISPIRDEQEPEPEQPRDEPETEQKLPIIIRDG